MANTFSQIYIQIVFAVKGRANHIPAPHKAELHKYITGIVKNKRQKLLAVNSVPNHIHVLVAMTPDVSISDLVRDIKRSSSLFINERNWIRGRFSWQEGFGAFSYSQSHVDVVKRYIENQEEHHKKMSFREEYETLLKKNEIQYDERFVFEDD